MRLSFVAGIEAVSSLTARIQITGGGPGPEKISTVQYGKDMKITLRLWGQLQDVEFYIPIGYFLNLDGTVKEVNLLLHKSTISNKWFLALLNTEKKVSAHGVYAWQEGSESSFRCMPGEVPRMFRDTTPITVAD